MCIKRNSTIVHISDESFNSYNSHPEWFNFSCGVLNYSCNCECFSIDNRIYSLQDGHMIYSIKKLD